MTETRVVDQYQEYAAREEKKMHDMFDRVQDQINEMNDILKEIRGLSGDKKV